jgi:sugar phosphate isomerase/epimerase
VPINLSTNGGDRGNVADGLSRPLSSPSRVQPSEPSARIAIHRHGPEDKLWHSPLDVLKAVKGLDPRIGCCIDVGHTVRAGTDVVQVIHEVGARLFNVHMNDLTNFQSKESQVAVGEGIMPLEKIFEALGAIKYKGFVDLEYEVHPDDPMPGRHR